MPSSSLCRTAIPAVLLMGLSACAPTAQRAPQWWTYSRGRLPSADLHLSIPDLGPATDAPDRSLHLCAGQPVVVLVHGCRGSAGLFRALAEVFAFHGQQAIAFSYNDRDSLRRSARKLNRSLQALSKAMGRQPITVIGHSQGGLIARAALVSSVETTPSQVHLVTISAPFRGIDAAAHCGSTPLRLLSLGLVMPICQAVTGSKWREIPRTSTFVQNPGQLSHQVASHLLVRTDERDSCRRVDAQGRCLSSDHVFSLEEQTQPTVEEDPRVVVRVVKAGHVEIVGDHRVPPVKLISLLQKEGILRRTEATDGRALEGLLARLYLAD